MSCYTYLQGRGVTRLCHFTKIKDLTHIISSDLGISAVTAIRPDVKDQKDPARYDGELDHVCCSVEYPNSWYLRKAQQRDPDQIFRDWVTIYIDLDILNHRDVKFCACNAATKHGAYVFSDKTMLPSLFESPVVSGRYRVSKMLSCCPTDDQAEILIKDSIPYQFFSGFAVTSEINAQLVYSIVETLGKPQIPIVIAPEVLNTGWSARVRSGFRPQEVELKLGKVE